MQETKMPPAAVPVSPTEREPFHAELQQWHLASLGLLRHESYLDQDGFQLEKSVFDKRFTDSARGVSTA